MFYLHVQVGNLKLRELASCSRSHTGYLRQIQDLDPNYLPPNQVIFSDCHWLQDRGDCEYMHSEGSHKSLSWELTVEFGSSHFMSKEP